MSNVNFNNIYSQQIGLGKKMNNTKDVVSTEADKTEGLVQTLSSLVEGLKLGKVSVADVLISLVDVGILQNTTVVNRDADVVEFISDNKTYKIKTNVDIEIPTVPLDPGKPTSPEEPPFEPINVTEPKEIDEKTYIDRDTLIQNEEVSDNAESTEGSYSSSEVLSYNASADLIAQFFTVIENNDETTYILKEGVTFEDFVNARIEENRKDLQRTVDHIYESLSTETSEWIALQMGFITGEYIASVQYDEDSEGKLLNELSNQEGLVSADEIKVALEFIVSSLDGSCQKYTEADLLKQLVECKANGGIELLNNMAANNLQNFNTALNAFSEYIETAENPDFTFDGIREFLTEYFYNKYTNEMLVAQDSSLDESSGSDFNSTPENAQLGEIDEKTDVAIREYAAATVALILPKDEPETSMLGMVLAACINEAINETGEYSCTADEVFEYMNSSSQEEAEESSSQNRLQRKRNTKASFGGKAFDYLSQKGSSVCNGVKNKVNDAITYIEESSALGGIIVNYERSMVNAVKLAVTPVAAEASFAKNVYKCFNGECSVKDIFTNTGNDIKNYTSNNYREINASAAKFGDLSYKVFDDTMMNLWNSMNTLGGQATITVIEKFTSLGLGVAASVLGSPVLGEFAVKGADLTFAAAEFGINIYVACKHEKEYIQNMRNVLGDTGRMSDKDLWNMGLSLDYLEFLVGAALSAPNFSKTAIKGLDLEKIIEIAKSDPKKIYRFLADELLGKGVLDTIFGYTDTFMQEIINGFAWLNGHDPNTNLSSFSAGINLKTSKNNYVKAGDFGSNFTQVSGASQKKSENANKTYVARGTIPAPESNNTEQSEPIKHEDIERLVAQEVYLKFGSARTIRDIQLKPNYDDQGNLKSYNFSYGYTDNTNYDSLYVPGGEKYSDYDLQNQDPTINNYTNNLDNMKLYDKNEWDRLGRIVNEQYIVEDIYTTASARDNYDQETETYVDPETGYQVSITKYTVKDKNGDITDSAERTTVVDPNSGKVISDKITTTSWGGTEISVINGQYTCVVYYNTDERDDGLMKETVHYNLETHEYEIVHDYTDGRQVVITDVKNRNLNLKDASGNVINVSTDDEGNFSIKLANGKLVYGKNGEYKQYDSKGNLIKEGNNKGGSYKIYSPETGKLEREYDSKTQILKVYDSKTGELVGYAQYDSEGKSPQYIESDKTDKDGNHWHREAWADGRSTAVVTDKEGNVVLKMSQKYTEKNGVWGVEKTTTNKFGYSQINYPDGTTDFTADMGADGVAKWSIDSNGDIVEYSWTSADGSTTIKNKDYETFAKEMYNHNTVLWESHFEGQNGYGGTITYNQLLQQMIQSTGWAPGVLEEYEDAVANSNFARAEYLWDYNNYYKSIVEAGCINGRSWEEKYYRGVYDDIRTLTGKSGEQAYLEQLMDTITWGTADEALEAMRQLSMLNSQLGSGSSGTGVTQMPYIDIAHAVDTMENWEKRNHDSALNAYLATIGENYDAMLKRASDNSEAEEPEEETAANAPARSKSAGTTNTNTGDSNITGINRLQSAAEIQKDNISIVYDSDKKYNGLESSIETTVKYEDYSFKDSSHSEVTVTNLQKMGDVFTTDDFNNEGEGLEVALNNYGYWQSRCSEDAQKYVNSHINTYTLIFELIYEDPSDAQTSLLADKTELLDKAFDEYYADVQAYTYYQCGYRGLDALNSNRDDLKEMFMAEFTSAETWEKDYQQFIEDEVNRQYEEAMEKYNLYLSDPFLYFAYSGTDHYEIDEETGEEKLAPPPQKETFYDKVKKSYKYQDFVSNKVYSTLLNPCALDFRTKQANDIMEEKMGKYFDYALQYDINGNCVITVNREKTYDYVGSRDTDFEKFDKETTEFTKEKIDIESTDKDDKILQNITKSDFSIKIDSTKYKFLEENKQLDINPELATRRLMGNDAVDIWLQKVKEQKEQSLNVLYKIFNSEESTTKNDEDKSKEVNKENEKDKNLEKNKDNKNIKK